VAGVRHEEIETGFLHEIPELFRIKGHHVFAPFLLSGI
jgi:hypothetical protein